MEARPFSIRDVLWGILDNLVHLYPLFLLGGLAIELPVAAASSLVWPVWSSLLNVEERWLYPSPIGAIAGVFWGLVVLAIWKRSQHESVSLRPMLGSIGSCAVPLGVWLTVYYTMTIVPRRLAGPANDDAIWLILLPSFLLAALVFMPMVPLIVIERQGVFSAVFRSFRLIRLKPIQVVVVTLAVGTLTAAVDALFTVLVVENSVDLLIAWGYRGEWNAIV
jgi:hypothetical protein